MKKFKNLFMVLALALLVVFGVKAIAAQAGTVTVNGPEGAVVSLTSGETTITINGSGSGDVTPGTYEVKVNKGYSVSGETTVTIGEDPYEITVTEKQAIEPEGNAILKENVKFLVDEMLLVVPTTGDGQLYYQLVKKAEDQDKLKDGSWLPAVWGCVEYRTAEEWLDCEGYCIDLSACTKEVYVAVSFDPTAKTCAAGNIITVKFDNTKKISAKAKTNTTVVIDSIDPGYDGEARIKLADIITFDKDKTNVGTKQIYQWRRSANVAWNYDTEENGNDLFKNYAMLRASNGTLYIRSVSTDTAYEFATKEVKVKIPKTPAAPKVKIDYQKNTIDLGKEVEIVASISGADLAFVHVTGEGATRKLSAGSGATTKESGKAIPVEGIVESLGVADGAEFTFYVRSQATEKKYASYFYQISEKAPEAAPTIVLEWDVNQKKVSIKDAGTTAYEYKKSGKFAKFSPLDPKTEKELEIRLAGIKAKNATATAEAVVGKFASKSAKVTVPEKASTAKTYTVKFASSTSGVPSTSGGATIQVGSLSGSEFVGKAITDDKTTVEEGKDLNFTVTGDDVAGKVVTDITVKNGETSINSVSGVYTLKEVKKDTDLTIIVFYGDPTP